MLLQSFLHRVKLQSDLLKAKHWKDWAIIGIKRKAFCFSNVILVLSRSFVFALQRVDWLTESHTILFMHYWLIRKREKGWTILSFRYHPKYILPHLTDGGSFHIAFLNELMVVVYYMQTYQILYVQNSLNFSYFLRSIRGIQFEF